MQHPEIDRIGHVDHAKTTLTVAFLNQEPVQLVKPRLTSEIVLLPSWQRLYDKTRRRAKAAGVDFERFSDLPPERRGGKAARRMQCRQDRKK